MKKRIKINFCDFSRNFSKTDNQFTRVLAPYYDLEISDSPDFIIYSCFDKNGNLPWQHTPVRPYISFVASYFDKDGRLPWSSRSRTSAAQEFKKYQCIRIFYTSENVRPNFRECDYAFSYDYGNNINNYRWPLYGQYRSDLGLPFVGVGDVHPLVKDETFDPVKILKEKNQFCNFVYSNRHAKRREKFFHKLSKYKRVDSGGKYLNNMGGYVKNKLEFLKPYKFTIAFENSSYPGYTTEKIYQPMLVHSLPIYWGNPLIYQDFNTKSFLNYHEFESEEALIEKIIEIDQNDDLYIKYLKQPYFVDNKVNQFADPERLLKHFDYIFNNSKTPVAQEKARKKKFIVV
ncbi:MAG: hypothetical protein LDL41_15135 [Coleofasciculus sp. S288]|nr:hypothetical protein [Coleofasciculus sp. S288]